jgi:hypothetical protein
VKHDQTVPISLVRLKQVLSRARGSSSPLRKNLGADISASTGGGHFCFNTTPKTHEALARPIQEVYLSDRHAVFRTFIEEERMRKMKLSVEDLQVESFSTAQEFAARGTVLPHQFDVFANAELGTDDTCPPVNTCNQTHCGGYSCEWTQCRADTCQPEEEFELQ